MEKKKCMDGDSKIGKYGCRKGGLQGFLVKFFGGFELDGGELHSKKFRIEKYR
jgi:hypothetical protein